MTKSHHSVSIFGFGLTTITYIIVYSVNCNANNVLHLQNGKIYYEKFCSIWFSLSGVQKIRHSGVGTHR